MQHGELPPTTGPIGHRQHCRTIAPVAAPAAFAFDEWSGSSNVFDRLRIAPWVSWCCSSQSIGRTLLDTFCEYLPSNSERHAAKVSRERKVLALLIARHEDKKVLAAIERSFAKI